jgi:hypothetical protein
MNSHFYVTLPSDSSVGYYPNNTIARFVTKLPERIRLEGDYEMGLAEIIYPHTWYNFDNEDERYWIGAAPKKGEFFPKIIVQSGYYEDGSVLADSLNRECHRTFEDMDVKFSYSETIGRFSLSVHSPGSHLFVMSEDLQRYLGFELKTLSFAVDKQSYGMMAERAFDANRGLHLIYVYCDAAAHAIVGDTKTPLLRVCNVAGKHGDVVRHTYDQPHYAPVGRREFDTIEIAINNEIGKPMPFEYGKSVVILHFRRRFAKI